MTQGPEDRVDAFREKAHAPETDDGTEEEHPRGGAAGDSGGPKGRRDKRAAKASRGDDADGKEKAADIGIVGMIRWAWRQLTTMRVALMLLFMLALAAIPGSLLPQRLQDAAATRRFIQNNGGLGEVLDFLQFFDVYSSWWFSAVYILLLVSLVGCIIPRTRVHWRAMRSAPPKAPRRMERMPAHEEKNVDAAADSVLDAAEKIMRGRGYRVKREDGAISAEKGYLRETGNLVFHVAVLGAVICMAFGGLFGYGGQRVLVEGETFTNSLVAYDSFEKGTYFNPDTLDSFRLTLDDFNATFDNVAAGNQYGQPRSFEGRVTTEHKGKTSKELLKVNEPVRFDGSAVYLLGNGYAPDITVRDGEGNIAFSGPVIFLPQDGVYTSRGVIKVPDAKPEQLGFVAVLFPTAGQDENGQIVSKFADIANPYLVLSAYQGDLGLDTGEPQSVYSLDPSKMTQLKGPDGKPLVLQLAPGESTQLPNGNGTISFDGVKRYMAVDIRHNPTQGWMLVFSTFILLGLAASLFIPRRRAWVKATEGEDGTRMEVAALARGDDPRLKAEVDRLAVELDKAL